MQQRIFKEHRPRRRDRSQIVEDAPLTGGDDITDARDAAAAAQSTIDAIDAALADG